MTVSTPAPPSASESIPAVGHSMVVCTTCRPQGTTEAPGAARIPGLVAALEAADPSGDLARGVAVGGMACMAGCKRPCTVAFQAPGKCGYLFGDLDLEADADALVEFARLYRDSADGFTRTRDRPDGLRGKILARLPAPTMISAPEVE